jgi:GNAT superfamily N-acetyltransferase
MRFRPATAEDAAPIASLHADSWRRYYRGAYSDAFLDGDVTADRRTVWSARLAGRTAGDTILAECDGRLVGFVHVVPDEDPRWGSLVDNLHVAHDQHRRGVGTRLLRHAATVAGRGPMHLWVLEQNSAARTFYTALGAACVETAMVSPPGGEPSRLNGTPRKLRMAWPDVADHLS